MIPFKFEYYKPDTLEEAFDLFNDLSFQGKAPVYYAGGTELITMARANNIHMGAVIDIKGIPECCSIGVRDNKLYIGSAITLSQITEAKLFHLLGQTAARIADHTVQCKLTIGGNICGTIIYRETLLPLLLCDSMAVVFGAGGKRTVPINQVFNKQLKLTTGEFLVNLLIDNEYCSLPYVHVKKTKNEKIAYPLLTVAAIKKDNQIRAAFSGLCSFPFRSGDIESYLNDTSLDSIEKIKKISRKLSNNILNDTEGSSSYRSFALENTLENTLKMLEKM